MPSAMPNTQSFSDFVRSDDFISKILENCGNKQSTDQQKQSGSRVDVDLSETSADAELIKTSDYINKLIENGANMRRVNVSAPSKRNTQDELNQLPSNMMVGGNDSKNKVFGSRRMMLYSEFDNLSGGSDSDSEFFTDGGISRQATSQVDIVHERTIKKIEELMNVDNNVARDYKAVLYKQVKDSDKDSKLTPYERAIEMEKLVNKDVLSKIDIKKKKSAEIKKHLEEKALSKNISSTSDSDVKPSGKSKGKTSKSKVISDSDLSATS